MTTAHGGWAGSHAHRASIETRVEPVPRFGTASAAGRDLAIDGGSDDGSRARSQDLETVEGLYDAVAPGGDHVIEDMHTTYWPRGLERR
jgi:hypothetical protein